MKETEKISVNEESDGKGTDQDKLSEVQNKEKQDILDVHDKDNTKPKENQNPHKPCSLALLFNTLFPKSDVYYDGEGQNGKNIVKIRQFLNNLTPDDLNNVVKLPMSSKNDYQLIDNISNWEIQNRDLVDKLGLILPEKKARIAKISDDKELFNIFFNSDFFTQINKQLKDSIISIPLAQQFLLKTTSKQKANQI